MLQRTGFSLSRPGHLALLLVLGASGCGGALRTSPTLTVPKAQGPDKGRSSETLLEDKQLDIDAQGRATTTRRYVYVVHKKAALRWASMVSTSFAPWREARPQIRAVVTTKEGKRHVLDPKTLTEQPYRQRHATILDDRRVLKGPLPGIAVGARVDITVVNRETKPLTPHGGLHTFSLEGGKRRLWRLTIRGPEAMRVAVLGPVKLRPRSDRRGGGRREVVYQEEAFEAKGLKESWVPRGFYRSPGILVTTVPSWQATAASYRALIAKKLAVEVPPALLQGLPGKGASTTERVDALLARIHRRVRYTGLEFGQAAIVPRDARETLRRGYGDCKDKSALLIAGLRKLGIRAHIALVRSSFGADLHADLPGLEAFNHAIVFVPDGKLWVDPTYPNAPAGQLPAVNQGRRALVIAADTTRLTETPVSSSQDNSHEEQRTYTFSLDQQATVEERLVTRGESARRMRRWSKRFDAAGLRRYAKRHLLRRYQASAGQEVKLDDKRRGGFSVRFAAKGGAVGTFDEDEIVVPLSQGQLFNDVVGTLRRRQSKPRKQPLVGPLGFSAQIRYRIVAPPPYRYEDGPRPFRLEAGGVRFSLAVEPSKDKRRVELVATLLTPRRIERGDVAAAQKLFAGLLKSGLGRVRFVHRGNQLLGEGKGAEGLALYRRWATKDPRAAWLYAFKLVGLGLGDDARQVARRAAKARPKDMVSLLALGRVFEYDRYGRLHRRGFLRSEAIAAYRRAKALDGDDLRPRRLLADVLRRSKRGQLADVPSDQLEAALKEYRELVDKLGDHSSRAPFAYTLLMAGELRELSKLLETWTSGGERDAYYLTLLALQGRTEAYRRWISAHPRKAPTITRQVSKMLVVLGAYERVAAIARSLTSKKKRQPKLLAAITLFERLAAVKKRPPKAPTSLRTPIAVVRALGKRLAGGEGAFLSMFDLYYRGRELAKEEKRAPEIARAVRADMLRRLGTQGAGVSFLRDIIAAAKLSEKGDARRGWEVTFEMPGQKKSTSLFLVSTKAGPRIIGAFDGYGAIGRWLAEQLRRRAPLANLTAALDWASKRKSGRALRMVWPGAKHARRRHVRFASALLRLQENSRDSEALERLLKGKLSTMERELAVRLLVAHYSTTNRARRLLGVLRRAKGILSPSQIERARLGAMLTMRRYRQVLAWVNKRLRDNPRDPEARVARIHVALGQGRFERAWSLAQGLRKESVKLAAGPLNLVAWAALYQQKISKKRLREALDAAKSSDKARPTSATKNTIAALYAELGDLRQAHSFWLQSRSRRLSRGDRLILGWIAERGGLSSTAKRVYGGIDADPNDPSLFTVHELARRRSKRLAPRGAKP